MEKKLEEGTSATITVPKGQRDVRVWDTVQDGLFLRVQKTGRATYGVRYFINGRPKTRTIRQVVPDVKGLALARKDAADIRAKAQLGQDLVAELAAAKEAASRPVVTMGDVVTRYLKARKKDLRPRSYEEVRRHLEVNLKDLHKRPIREITRAEIVCELDELADNKSPGTADAAKRAMSTLYVWAVDRELCDGSPVIHIKIDGLSGPRKRKLSMDELAEIWSAAETLDNTAYGRIVRVLILNGCRRNEVGSLDWSEVNEKDQQIEVPPERAKNKRKHIVPMSDQVLALLPARRNSTTKVFGRYDKEDGTGFSGWSRAKVDLDAAILEARRKVNPKTKPMPRWVLHDLRRAFATHMHESKFDGAPTGDKHLVELMLNHVSGTKGGIAGVYDESERLDDRREALAAWGNYLVRAVAAVSASAPAAQEPAIPH